MCIISSSPHCTNHALHSLNIHVLDVAVTLARMRRGLINKTTSIVEWKLCFKLTEGSHGKNYYNKKFTCDNIMWCPSCACNMFVSAPISLSSVNIYHQKGSLLQYIHVCLERNTIYLCPLFTCTFTCAICVHLSPTLPLSPSLSPSFSSSLSPSFPP